MPALEAGLAAYKDRNNIKRLVILTEDPIVEKTLRAYLTFGEQMTEIENDATKQNALNEQDNL